MNDKNGHVVLAEKPQAIIGNWVEVCAVDDLDEEEVIGFEHNGKKYAIYRLQETTSTPVTVYVPTKKWSWPTGWSRRLY